MESADVNNHKPQGENGENKPLEANDNASAPTDDRDNSSSQNNTENSPPESGSDSLKMNETEIQESQVLGDHCDENGENVADSTQQDDKTSKLSQTQPYIAPLENPYEKAWKYLFKHDILSLFQGITADIAAVLPDDPIEHMINAIEDIQEKDRRRKGITSATSESHATDVQQGKDATGDVTSKPLMPVQEAKSSESHLDKDEDSMKSSQESTSEYASDEHTANTSTIEKALQNFQESRSADNVASEENIAGVANVEEDSLKYIPDILDEEGSEDKSMDKPIDNDTTVVNDDVENPKDKVEPVVGKEEDQYASDRAEASDNPADNSNEEIHVVEPESEPDSLKVEGTDNEAAESIKDGVLDPTDSTTKIANIELPINHQN